MSYEKARRVLDWPSREKIMDPPGAGSKIVLKLAQQKIERSLRLLPGGSNANVGVLTGNPHAASTETPISIICEFYSQVPDETLKQAHKLAWNFCRSPLLVTIEPDLLRSWSCHTPP